jgi:glycosidase
LNWNLLERDEHQSLHRLYRLLFRLRRETPALRSLDLRLVETHADDERKVLLVRRGGEVLVAFNFGEKAQAVDVPWEFSGTAMIDTGAKLEGGKLTLPPHAFALFSA